MTGVDLQTPWRWFAAPVLVAGCHCISSRSGLHRRRAPPSSASQQHWA